MNRWEKDMKIIQGWWKHFSPVANSGIECIISRVEKISVYAGQFVWSLALLCGIGIFLPFYLLGVLIKQRPTSPVSKPHNVTADGLVDWATMIPWCTVAYSYLVLPHDPYQLDQDVARIHLDDGYKIFIDWDDDKNLFYARLCPKDFEHPKKLIKTDNIDILINQVVQWAGEHYMPHLENYA